MIKQPLFIHINSCGGRYIRKKLVEKYNDNFIVHHINPLLYRDLVPRNKIVRIWQYKDVTRNKGRNIIKKYDNKSIFDIPNTVPFLVLRNPIERYKTENKHHKLHISEQLKDERSYNIICKSLFVAFTGDYNEYFLKFNEKKFKKILEYLKDIKVILLERIYLLSDIFEFNTPPIYKKHEYKNKTYDSEIRDKNYFDYKLYKLYLNR